MIAERCCSQTRLRAPAAVVGAFFLPCPSRADALRHAPTQRNCRLAGFSSWVRASRPGRWCAAWAVSLHIGLAASPAAGQGAVNRLDRDAFVSEAAARFRIPASWIFAVMAVESGHDPRAVSEAGAMGLMQVMPRTYAELRARYGLGKDPFHPRDNVLAGSAYLRELYDRFGAPGFLAAYNAGPERYAQHLATGRPLPLETRRYLALLTPRIVASAPAVEAGAPAPRQPLFVDLEAHAGDAAYAPSALFVSLSHGGGPR